MAIPQQYQNVTRQMFVRTHNSIARARTVSSHWLDAQTIHKIQMK